MSVRPVRVGVIGLGVGQRHLAGYLARPGVEVRGLCDVDGAHLDACVRRHGLEGVYTTRQAHRLLDRGDLDAVSICSYDQDHARQVVRALNNGLAVMVEKPLCLLRREFATIARAWEDQGRPVLSSNFVLRAVPRFRALRARIRAGAFGEIFYVEGDYLHGILHKLTDGWRGRQRFYCVTYGGGIHMIDLLAWLLGRRVCSVSGMASGLLTVGSACPWPDCVANVLRFEGGIVGRTTSAFGVARPHFHRLNVYGSRLSFENSHGSAQVYGEGQEQEEELAESPYPAVDKDALLDGFLAAVRGAPGRSVHALEVFDVMEVCFAAWESVRRGRSVDVSYTFSARAGIPDDDDGNPDGVQEKPASGETTA